MRRAIVCAWAVVAVGVLSADAEAAAKTTAKQIFNAAAGRDGPAYAVARDALAVQGKAILPLLKTESRSGDWRRRALAEALILRITRPDEVAVWTRLWWWKHELTFRADGTVLVKFAPGEVAYYARKGRKLPAIDSVAIDRRAVPFVLDFVREEAGSGSASQYQWRTGRAFKLLRHFADPGSVETLIHFGSTVYRQDPAAVAALVKIGKPAVGPLCLAAAEVSGDWHVARRQAAAADALAGIGQKDAAAVLIAALPKLKWPETIVAYCRAIARLGGEHAPGVLFDELVAAGRAWPGRSVHINTHPTPYASYYNPIREALVSLGPASAGVLKARSAVGSDLLGRAVAAGVLAELMHGKGAEKGRTARAIELTVALRHGPSAVTLAKLKQDPMAFEALASFVAGSDGRKTYYERHAAVPQVVTALAEASHPRAVELYGMMLAKRPAAHVSTIVEALLIAADPKGAAVLKGIIARAGTTGALSVDQYKSAAALGRAVLPVLEGRAGHLVTLLASDSASIRVTAARQLARKGDLRALGVLVAEALGTKGPAHARLREAIVAMGKAVVAPLRGRRAKAPDWREKLFCEALILRVTKPKLAAAMHAAGLIRDHGFMTRLGPTVGTFGGAGRRVADAVGPEAVPMLEAAVVWQADSVRAGIAVFALARFKQPRSVAVLASDFNGPGWAQGGNLVAAALPAFGAEGIEAAKKVPPADPSKAQFTRRVIRHRAATSTLVAVKDDKGVEGVLAGLKLAVAGKIRADRAGAYLRLGANYDDPRLIELTFKVLNKFGPDVYRSALGVLIRHDDRRIVPVCLKVLSWRKGWPSDSGQALRGLARVKGKQLIPFLIEQLAGHKDASVRTGIAQNVTRVLASPGAYLWPDQPKPSDKEHAGHVEQVLDALRGRLADSGRTVQVAAADALARYANGRGMKKYVQPLLAWTKAHQVPVARVMDYLVWSREPDVGPVLLACYRTEPLRRSHVASRLAKAGYKEAIGDIAAALDRRVAKGGFTYVIPEVDVLGSFGKPGCEALYRVFERRTDPRFRVQAATTLCQRSHKGAFDEAHKLFDRFIAGEPDKILSAVKYADERKRRYQYCVMVLAEGLIGADRNRAYPIVALALINTGDANTRKQLAWRLKRLREAHPDLARIRVPLAP